jgi:hypothetical protein
LKEAVLAPQLHALLSNLHRDTDVLWVIRPLLEVQRRDGSIDESLLLCGLLLKGNLAIPLQLAKADKFLSDAAGRRRRRLMVDPPVDQFALALSLITETPSLYMRFRSLALKYKPELRPSIATRLTQNFKPAFINQFASKCKKKNVVRVPHVTSMMADSDDSGSDWSC